MGVTESQWRRPGDEATEPAGAIEQAAARPDPGSGARGDPGAGRDAEAPPASGERVVPVEGPERRPVASRWVQPYQSTQEPAQQPGRAPYLPVPPAARPFPVGPPIGPPIGPPVGPPPAGRPPMGPAPVGPPPRLSAGAQPVASAGAWQGALRPPVFVVNQPARTRERPTYREPLPVQGGRVAGGAALASAWMLLLGLQASTARVYVWLTIIAGALACGTAIVLARFGDRGAAVGVAVASGVGVSIAGLVVAVRLAGGDWLLW